jgi:hypothetical protein
VASIKMSADLVCRILTDIKHTEMIDFDLISGISQEVGNEPSMIAENFSITEDDMPSMRDIHVYLTGLRVVRDLLLEVEMTHPQFSWLYGDIRGYIVSKLTESEGELFMGSDGYLFDDEEVKHCLYYEQIYRYYGTVI